MHRQVCLFLLLAIEAGSAQQAARKPVDAEEVPIEAPRVLLRTEMPEAPSAGRRVIPVGSGGSLQAAINSALPGDVIELAKGATFTGNFVLPNKKTGSTDWIIIRPANHASLPAEGTRMTPAIAAALALPRVVSPNEVAAFKTEAGAHHFRLVGLNISVAAQPLTWALVTLGDDEQKTLAAVPHDLVLDRTFVHGNATVTLRRCIVLNSASSAVIDSWVSDCHEKGADSQAILGYNGPGPYKIVNNYLEGAGENIMFGGSDPALPGVVPSDIEIRRNHIAKPIAWKGVWTVKNLFELKSAVRVVFEGNVLEGCWADGQGGAAIAIKSTNQGGNCPWCGSRDVNVRLNMIRNVGSGINLAGQDMDKTVNTPARFVSVTDNVISRMNVAPFSGEGRAFTLVNTLSNVSVAHNTISTSETGVVLAGIIKQLWFHDNIIVANRNTVVGDNMGAGAAVTYYTPGSTFTRNVFVPKEVGLPPGNFTVESVRGIGFEDPANENYRLIRISPFEKASSGGRDIGANVGAVELATKGVRTP